ncbi:MAG: hypothetical protein R2883_06010 [Caldisericia bacterium]
MKRLDSLVAIGGVTVNATLSPITGMMGTGEFGSPDFNGEKLRVLICLM